MKSLLSIIALIISQALNAATYYCATTGSDAAAGTIGAPFRTWAKLASVLVAGDIGYIRGGTYTSPLSPGANDWLCTIANRNGTSLNHITISAYPGETPIFDLTGFDQSNNTTAIRVNNCSWIDFIGLTVANVIQHTSNASIVAGWDIHDCHDMTFNRVTTHDIQGAGFRQAQGCDNFTYINCDFYRCGDPLSTGAGIYGNADGSDANYGTATFIGCRSWWNSDDGFDTFYNDSLCTYDNCWSFWNGYRPGTFSDPGPQADGMGFKWGISTTAQPNQIRRIYRRCISFQNKAYGYDQNVAQVITLVYNCTSWKNGKGAFATGYSINPRIANVIRNCISFQDPGNVVTDISGMTIDHNSWQIAAASAASFISLDTTGVRGARAADGSLPVLNFLHLVNGANQVDAGVLLSGILYNGAAPDLGAYETGGSTPVNIPPVSNAGSNQSITAPASTVTLNGSGSSDADGTITNYLWSLEPGSTAGGTITSQNNVSTGITSLVVGTNTYKLTVTDNSGASSTSTVKVFVVAAAAVNPVANAGSNQTITLPLDSVTLSGTSSFDPDGSISSYQWTNLSGGSLVIVSPTGSTTKVRGLTTGTWQIKLTVTDNTGHTNSDTVAIIVNPAPVNLPPIVDVGPDITIELPVTSVTLNGSILFSDTTIVSYLWQRVSFAPTGSSGTSSETIVNPTDSTTDVTGLVAGDYTFRLKVTDSNGLIVYTDVDVSVLDPDNQLPGNFVTTKVGAIKKTN